ncbi:MAG: transglycosylase family protein [Candidatus Saccharibacteria bacterium]|nr:transglycosylase family protein [Candidatus Saccharibacteria bacterium]
MSLTLVKSQKKLWSFAAVFAVTLLAVLLIFSLKTAQAADPTEKLVKIHDGNIDTSIITNKTTVADALKQAKIKTGPYDNVDPSLDTKINSTTYQVNVYRAQPVMVIDGLTKKTIMTAYETPKEIAKDAGLTLDDEDVAKLVRSPDVLNADGAGLTLTITRATKFTLMLYGKLLDTGTQAKTVGAMLQEKKIKIAKTDTVTVPLNTPVAAGMKVTIWREGVQTITEDQPIAFPVQQIQDANQPVGYKQIKTPGVLGKKTAVFEVNMRSGVEVARREIQSVQTAAPQQQVEIVGSKPSFSGDFAAALAKLRSCEGGYTSVNVSGGYYGAYQFNQSAWNANAPAGYAGQLPTSAPPAVQDQAARNYYVKSGWRPWPNCGKSLPDIYR